MTRGGDASALLKLASWLSPGFPTGAFAYSHGLDWAVASGEVTDAAGLAEYVATAVAHGSGRADAILLAHAWRDPADAEIADLAAALAPSAERRTETMEQGSAFARTVAAAWPAPGLDGAPCAYPVAVGRAARAHGVELGDAAVLYLHAIAANLVSAGVRLAQLGQIEGQTVLAGLAPLIERTAAEATEAGLDEIGSCALAIDMASMRHETQTVRLFRT